MSRSGDSPNCFSTQACGGVITKGNWVWLPSLSAIFPTEQFPPLWGFATPGSIDSIALGAPGANGNYQQVNGGVASLLNRSAICQGGGQADANRQTTNGIQSGCEGSQP